LKSRGLMIELFIHMLQPYPYLSANWDMIILGNTVRYSFDMILFSLCMLRLYVLVKVMKFWNLYTNNNSKRIFKFFKNKYIDMFFYKSNLKYYGFLSVCIIFSVLLYISSLVFKVYENFDGNEEKNFGYFWNCLWFLAQSMSTGKEV
jgi:hypothetical protein